MRDSLRKIFASVLAPGVGTTPVVPLAEWKLNETSGTTVRDTSGNGYNGLYKFATLNNSTWLNGDPVPLFGSMWCEMYSTALRDNFPHAEGSLEANFKLDATEWATTTTRYLVSFRSSGASIIAIYKSGKNRLTVSARGKTFTLEINPTVWTHIVLTWSTTDGHVWLYYNGIRVPATMTSLSAWSGTLLATYSIIGAQTDSGTNKWTQQACRISLFNRALTASEVYNKWVDPYPTDTPSIFCLGDSKTHNNMWVDFLHQAISTEESATWCESPQRLAVGGYDVAELLAYASTELPAIKGRVPDKILINVGVNDAPTASLPVEAVWKADWASLIALLQTKYPGIPIYIDRIWRADYPANCATLNGWIDDVIAAGSGLYAGADESVWLENGDNGATYSSDGIHYNDAGQVAAKNAKLIALGY